ncbi:DUF4123 domain-containing protein [Marinobacter sp. CHS3-4]|uniref:DUF4123 domain-containing protein n=1 Tax=Marinobacter sp. CHS3-4 TaxID=3045174 RepID=UPI0024B5DD73|nr:DUF4123 domain-containing protein [Marinobacter sp. CHS3-4]MDI9244423.1 DUF4123 domain-containing protein [Marinobacter sp. CHS3-4]
MSEVNVTDVSGLSFSNSNLQWYALLEGAHPTFNTPGLIYSHIELPESVALYQNSPYEALSDVSPILVKIDQPHDWLHHWQGAFPSLDGLMLSSKDHLEVVAAHLQTLVSVRVEGGADAIFRFHDSWVASSLYPTLDESEKTRLHGVVRQWLWVCGRQAFTAERADEAAQDEPPLSDGWLQLSKASQLAISNGMLSKRNWKESQQ